MKGIRVRFDRVRNLANPLQDHTGFELAYMPVVPLAGSIINLKGNPFVVLDGGGFTLDDTANEGHQTWAYVRVIPAWAKGWDE